MAKKKDNTILVTSEIKCDDKNNIVEIKGSHIWKTKKDWARVKSKKVKSDNSTDGWKHTIEFIYTPND